MKSLMARVSLHSRTSLISSTDPGAAGDEDFELDECVASCPHQASNSPLDSDEEEAEEDEGEVVEAGSKRKASEDNVASKRTKTQDEDSE